MARFKAGTVIRRVEIYGIGLSAPGKPYVYNKDTIKGGERFKADDFGASPLPPSIGSTTVSCSKLTMDLTLLIEVRRSVDPDFKILLSACRLSCLRSA